MFFLLFNFEEGLSINLGGYSARLFGQKKFFRLTKIWPHTGQSKDTNDIRLWSTCPIIHVGWINPPQINATCKKIIYHKWDHKVSSMWTQHYQRNLFMVYVTMRDLTTISITPILVARHSSQQIDLIDFFHIKIDLFFI